MWFTCCLNMFLLKNSQDGTQIVYTTSNDNARLPQNKHFVSSFVDVNLITFHMNDVTNSKNKMASMDVYSAVKATLSWFFKLLRRDFSWNHIKCKNNDQICLFQCINICRVPHRSLNIRPSGLLFKQLPQDPAIVIAWKKHAWSLYWLPIRKPKFYWLLILDPKFCWLLTSGVPHWDLNRSEISDMASVGIKLSRQRIIKVLFRQDGCAGWSVSLLFAYIWHKQVLLMMQLKCEH